MLGTLPPQTIDHHGGMMNPAKRFRREGSLPDTDHGSSDSSPDTSYNRKYAKSSVKSGKTTLNYCVYFLTFWRLKFKIYCCDVLTF